MPSLDSMATGSESPIKANTVMPDRFMCHGCGVCIVTSEGLLETRDEALVFCRLLIQDTGGQKSLSCPYCELGLGTRGDGSFFLRRDRLVKRSDQLDVLVCSLKQQEITDVVPVLQQTFPHSKVNGRVLLKAELRGFQLSGHSPDLVVVVHRNEGRALLTDRNGFYHDVLGSAWQQTRGNVLIIVTKTEAKGEQELYDVQLLNSLSTQGDQPTVGALSALGRVLTWETAPSAKQLQHLQQLSSKAYFREVPATHPAIPGQWCVKPQKPQPHSSTWCNLL